MFRWSSICLRCLFVVSLLARLCVTQAQSPTTLYNFTGIANGANPTAGLIQGADGNFYGTTLYGGKNRNGSVFKITPSGVFTLLHSFGVYSAPNNVNTDGTGPMAGLVQATDGSLYGTTYWGGSAGYGTVFKITTAGVFTVLHSFLGGSDGAYSTAGLVQAADGNLYGTTSSNAGSTVTYGTVFKITTVGVFSTLYTFSGGSDGGNPMAALIQGTDGKLYGTTYDGGNGEGTVFKITTGGALTTLHRFRVTDGYTPTAGLIQGADGAFYGTTAGSPGTIFKITSTGVFTSLYTFTGDSDGDSPSAGLIQGTDGAFYGTTPGILQGTYNVAGGTTAVSNAARIGTVFKFIPGSPVTTLHPFSAFANPNTGTNVDGAYPVANLLQGKNGVLYGTAEYGGAKGYGTIFSLQDLPEPILTLTQATTPDAQSVSVSYTISKAGVSAPLRFDFYRSDQPTKDSASHLIGTQVLDPAANATDLTQGTHTVTMAAGTALLPGPAMPYVVVVANADGNVAADPASVTTTYFRKYLLGGIVHGLSLLGADAGTLAWMNALRDDLLQISRFDNVITHDWTVDSRSAQPYLVNGAGHDMNREIVAAAKALLQRNNHPGDVVDLHLIGHSRGTVVVSQVLQDMAAGIGPNWSGSYVEATLLDPHPANLVEDLLLSFSNNVPGWAAFGLAIRFQNPTRDPEIVLPNGAGLRSVDIWYQHTPAAKFPLLSTASVLNLWGEGKVGNHITNHSSAPLLWQDLTSKTFTDGGASYIVGHSEVHEYYRVMEAEQGFVK